MSQNIAKSMAYMISQLDGNFQQGSPVQSHPVAFNGHQALLEI